MLGTLSNGTIYEYPTSGRWSPTPAGDAGGRPVTATSAEAPASPGAPLCKVRSHRRRRHRARAMRPVRLANVSHRPGGPPEDCGARTGDEHDGEGRAGHSRGLRVPTS